MSLAYVAIMWRYIYHWQKLPVWDTPKTYLPKTKLSIIIPVRNEAEHIKACLSSILDQNYPVDLMEVIVVDDQSTDHTLALLKAIEDPRLKILELGDFLEAEEAQAFKKKAIEIAIDHAQGDLIVTTDGDCVVPPRWLQRITHFYEVNDLKFIAAPVNFYQECNLLEYFQSIDFTGMMGITGAGVQGAFLNMCNGANLAYDKAAFFEVDGFTGIDHLASGDDMLLMEKMARRFPQQLGYLKNREATVLTKAQETWTAFYHQRIRWASKSSDYQDWQVTAMLGIAWLFCWSILMSLLSIPLLGWTGVYLFLGQLLVKTMMDYALLSRTTRFFNRSDLMAYFFPAQVLHIFYIVSVGTLSLFIKKYQWKGRSVQ